MNRTLLPFILPAFFLLPVLMQAQNFNSWPAGSMGPYTSSFMTATVTRNNATMGDGTPKYVATDPGSPCYTSGGLALYAGTFSSYVSGTNSHITLTMNFTSGGASSGTCNQVAFTIKDINSDESYTTFLDVIEITAIDGNNAAISTASIATVLGSNVTRVNSGSTVKLVGHNNASEQIGSYSSSACNSTTLTVTPPSGVRLKSITIKYRPGYGTSSANAYYNSGTAPAAQYISIGNPTFTATTVTTPTFTTLGPYCQGAAGGTLPTTSNNSITGTWNWGSAVPTATAGTTTYTFTSTPALCATGQTMNVTVNATGAGSITPSHSICDGDVLSITSTPTTGTFTDLSYSFNTPGPPWNTLGTPSPFTWTSTGFGGATAYLQATFSNAGCIGTVQTQVAINALPATSAGNVCVSDNIILSATGGGSYSWSGPDGFTSNTQSPSISPADNNAAGWYYVTVTAANGCTKVDSTQVVKDIDCTLPIVLTEFSGRCENAVKIFTWTTASEINNHFFSLEKSNNGMDFESLAIIPGKGNSNQVSKYSFTEKSASPGFDYYRLKQTDYDGKYAYSEIIAVFCPIVQVTCSGLSFYPNPAREYLYIHAGQKLNSDLSITITDITGRTVIETALSFSTSTLTIPLTGISKGVYFLSVKGSTGFSDTPLQRFVKE